MLVQTDPDKTIDYFHVKICLWTVGQHCKRNYLVQCCLRHNYTTTARRYSYAMLGDSRITLRRVFTYAMLPKKYSDNIEQDFSYTMQGSI